MKNVLTVITMLLLMTSCTKGYYSCQWDEGVASQLKEYGYIDTTLSTYEKDIQFRWKRYYTNRTQKDEFLNLVHDCENHVRRQAGLLSNQGTPYDLKYYVVDFPGQE